MFIVRTPTLSKSTCLKRFPLFLASLYASLPQLKPIENKLRTNFISNQVLMKKHKLKIFELQSPLPLTDTNSGNKKLASLQGTIKNIKFLYTSIKQLSKGRLAGLVVLSAMCGYTLAPIELNIGALFKLVNLAAGTFMCVSSANTFNQYLEIEHDAKMQRTKNRILVRKIICKHGALKYAVLMSILGPLYLFYFVSPLVSALGLSNIILYAGVYTKLKRIHYINTWVGSVVGAIPPIMGYSAATGKIDMQGILLGGILYAWQFPHFNSLSYMIRKEYKDAGYKMLCNIDPSLNAKVSLRYSLLSFAICLGIYMGDLVTVYAVPTTSIINFYLTYYSYKFYKEQSIFNARKLFLASLIHLPIVFILLMAHKKANNKEGKQAHALNN